MSTESLSEALKRLEQGMPPPPQAGFLGASLRPEDCALVLIPVPWDATVSYGCGTSGGPEALVSASHQLDLEDAVFEKPYRAGITMLPEDREISSLNKKSREKVVAKRNTNSSGLCVGKMMEKRTLRRGKARHDKAWYSKVR